MKWAVIEIGPHCVRAELDHEIRAAFDIWEEASSLTFHHTDDPEQADIKISFVRGKHFDYGDPYALDGSSQTGGTTLAHAFFPKGSKIVITLKIMLRPGGEHLIRIFIIMSVQLSL